MRWVCGYRGPTARVAVFSRTAARLAHVLALAAGLLLLPLPCADDLLVEAGSAADQCAVTGLVSGAHQDAPSPGDASCCPCACHVGIARGPALAPLPEPQQGTLRTPLIAHLLDPISAAITHPPLG
jgi:hypothetical protein